MQIGWKNNIMIKKEMNIQLFNAVWKEIKLKPLERVTITGADDSVDPQALLDLSNTYPFVEWGILLSKDKSGVERYPSQKWRDELFRLWNQNQNLHLSGHICGKWVRDIIEGKWCLNEITGQEMFSRFQLNFSPYICDAFKWSTPDLDGESFYPVAEMGNIDRFLKGFDDPNLYFRQFIFQTNSFTPVHEHLMARTLADEIDAVWMFDVSGGRGVLPEEWIKPKNGSYAGFAGGLNPDNVCDQLKKINKINGKNPYWIDVESGVRTDDKFDLGKVTQFLYLTQFSIESIPVGVSVD